MKKLLLGFVFGLISVSSLALGPQEPKEPSITRILKESYPAPGLYCYVMRPFNSYEETNVVAANHQLLKIHFIKACLKTLPKYFVVKTEAVQPFLYDDHRAAEVEMLQCSYIKPAGGPPRFSIRAVFPHNLSQDVIDECFKRAQAGPNMARPPGNA